MIRKILKIDSRKTFSVFELDKLAALSIQNHFRLSNYQMLLLSWVKGLWTGILLSLIIHYFISH